MQYKACLLAAGINDRVRYARGFNNALVPIGYRAGLSRILEKFSEDTEIVIALGYNGSLIREFTKIAHPNRKLTFVEVDRFSGEGAGSGYSLLCCKEHLQCPFIFTSADTIVREDVPPPLQNWIGVAKVADSSNYLVAEIDGNYVTELYDKKPTDYLIRQSTNYEVILNNGFIGMAGVHDYKAFWGGLEIDTGLVQGKRTVTNGLRWLVKRQLQPFRFSWIDTGNELGHIYAARLFSKNETIIKPEEFLYFENGKVIKYYAKDDVVKKRIRRAEILQDVVPELTFKGKNFYAYEYIEGDTLSQDTKIDVFNEFLGFCERTIWKVLPLTCEAREEFLLQCRSFYESKTRNRIQKAYEEMGIKDAEETINSIRIPKLTSLFERIDWEWLSQGVPVLFHGDLQPENIIVGSRGFQLIDWRHEFGDIVEFGDIYYDFAKLHHALMITHEVIRKNEFSIDVNGSDIRFNFMIKNNLLEFLQMFEAFLEQKGFDLKKVRMLSALTYLNIAPLHHAPYNLLLYYFGKYRLYQMLI